MKKNFSVNEDKKRVVGEKAADYIKDGMTIGLGSGSTVYWTLKKLGQFVENGMSLSGIPSSKRTEGWAKEFGIPLIDFTDVDYLDIAIDGADEVDSNLNLSKGGGGSLLREKLVDVYANKLIIVVDQSKMVTQLGKFPLPVEVVPFGWEVTAKRIESLGSVPKLRMNENEFFITNNGNYILDCQFDTIENPAELHNQLKLLLGVVETGLFVDMTDIVIVGEDDGVRIVEKKN
ncbi:ribose-5-phosphate isomerase RpiA [Cytobacillus sp. S13-E01]|uniref:ribose-5-phosphate isomerase RpiA n=1 Tax=Cytobacillus sp. S13-E01 TaxID=3031326 RepID=UPI0023D843B9|nr:ribose-5-phosphate isomerase RpiA [Cytobacillus sp. S13-E01]MDF0726343.1 ribose-5-phosphate isomerase RpiA [Cytobacillus sp. S13-E01]